MHRKEIKEKSERKSNMQIYIFPSALIILNIAAGIMCFIDKDYKKRRLLARGCGAEYLCNILGGVLCTEILNEK